MKKRFWAVPLAVMALSTGASAVELSNLHGQSCPEGYVGSYHFVNNQVPEGTPAGQLQALWDSGDSCQVTSYKVLLHVQHFRCTGVTGALTYAASTLPGRLVLSDFTCVRIKKCDPKYDPKCEL